MEKAVVSEDERSRGEKDWRADDLGKARGGWAREGVGRAPQCWEQKRGKRRQKKKKKVVAEERHK